MVLPDPDRSRVVLIGASRFTDPELPDLPAVRNNLDGLAASLRDLGRCTVVADPASPVDLVDPVHDAAMAAEDTLLIYYAGHGLVHPRTLGLLLAVVGSAPDRTHTAVPYDLVRENVIDSPARRKVVILDCCYSGRALGGMADPTSAVANEAIVEGTYLLASAPSNKQALSPPGERFTAFTGALLTLLTDGVPDGPELLHLDLVYRQVRDALRRAARPEPQLRTDNTAGELALIRNPWRRRPPVDLWRDLPNLFSSVDVVPQPSVRTRIRNQLREGGLDNSYDCPVCRASLTGHNFLRHFDKHSAIEIDIQVPDTFTLTAKPVVVDQRYQLGERISSTAYRATDIWLQKTVVVRQRSATDPIQLDHPAIVRVLAVLASHVVLEYVDGPTVAQLAPVRPALAVEIMTEVCGALDYAHRQGVVHGDVRSRTVMLAPGNAVKILNFTNNGDKASDLYAAGRLLAELLSGKPPAFGDPVPEGTPAHLEKVLRTALHPDGAARYQTADAFRRALQS